MNESCSNTLKEPGSVNAFVDSVSTTSSLEKKEDPSFDLSIPETLDMSNVGDNNLVEDSDNDQEVSYWMDEEERQQEKRSVLNEAITNITDGKVSPIVSTLNSQWEDISRTQKAYYLRKVHQIFRTV